jgi:predicted  nucleic acid-binding Zn-ribbon protein
MNADLERLITLQRLDSAAHDAERRLAEAPDREKALDARLEALGQHVAAAKEQLAANQTARRALEKDVAVHQGRLSKFRETAMAVKTNVEYHAVQKEIGFAQGEIKAIEDKELELMLAADDLSAAVKEAESALAADGKAVNAERQTMAADAAELKAALDRLRGERTDVVKGLSPQVLATFEQVARKRNGIAVSEARDGVCTICHVRLRPQIFNTVRRNDAIIQCDHCNRILFFVPGAAAPVATADTDASQSTP